MATDASLTPRPTPHSGPLSSAIQLLAASTTVDSFVWKLASISFAFAANFCFSLVLFGRTPVAAPA